MNKTFEKLNYEAHRSSAYAGVDKLLRATSKKYDRQNAIEWLESQDAYNLHKLFAIVFLDVIILCAISMTCGKLI